MILQTTQTYHLSQWESSDRLLMKDFNEDNAKTDAALTALAAQVAQRATQTALEALRQETAAATASVRTEAAAATEAVRVGAAAATETVRAGAAAATETVRAEAAAATEAVRVGAAAANQVVKLADITTKTAANQVDVDLSHLTITNYAELIVVPRLTTSAEANVSIYINNNRTSIYNHTPSSSGNCLLSYSSQGMAFVRLYPFTPSLYANLISFLSNGSGMRGLCRIAKSVLPASAFSYLTFAAPSNTFINAGGKITVYGVKL